ncbi:hypothetical protein BD414DRAFT_489335 [Trametes punicea]|nr:hypothetical protein BD414DRAFT_489335 [Trametes punicea]
MAPTTPSEEYVAALSDAVFSSLGHGGNTLRLLDPDTNKFCEYRLVKISRPVDTPMPHASTPERRLSRELSNPSPDTLCERRDSTSLDSRLRSDLLDRLLLTGASGHVIKDVPHLDRDRFYPLARLPSLSVRARGDGTPSLFNDSRASEASTLSPAPTPVRQLFPEAAVHRPGTPAETSVASNGSGSAGLIGLGFSAILKDDGTPFDGLGTLPCRTSTPHRARASPAEARLLWTRAESPKFNREAGEVATDPSPFNPLDAAIVCRKLDSTTTPAVSSTRTRSPPRAPAHRTAMGRPQSAMLPFRPDQDDVFLSRPIRVPGSLTQDRVRQASSARRRRGVELDDLGPRPASTASSTRGARRMTAEWVELESGAKKKPSWKP